ncbi:hypothetical protein OF829_13135 [Sphingomonas sp. LB-2]|nr:hypothetical protein [Sphingomonas caeni]
MSGQKPLEDYEAQVRKYHNVAFARDARECSPLAVREAEMNHLVSRKNDGISSPLRHPRFVIGSSALGAVLVLDIAAALLMGRLT